MVTNFAKAMGYEMPTDEGGGSFSDASSIASYAKASVHRLPEGRGHRRLRGRQLPAQRQRQPGGGAVLYQRFLDNCPEGTSRSCASGCGAWRCAGWSLNPMSSRRPGPGGRPGHRRGIPRLPGKRTGGPHRRERRLLQHGQLPAHWHPHRRGPGAHLGQHLRPGQVRLRHGLRGQFLHPELLHQHHRHPLQGGRLHLGSRTSGGPTASPAPPRTGPGSSLPGTGQEPGLHRPYAVAFDQDGTILQVGENQDMAIPEDGYVLAQRGQRPFETDFFPSCQKGLTIWIGPELPGRRPGGHPALHRRRPQDREDGAVYGNALHLRGGGLLRLRQRRGGAGSRRDQGGRQPGAGGGQHHPLHPVSDSGGPGL